MGMVALVLSDSDQSFSFDPETAAGLAELGITRASLLRDDEYLVVVLEGWAFDPTRALKALEVALVGHNGSTRILRELGQVSISKAQSSIG